VRPSSTSSASRSPTLVSSTSSRAASPSAIVTVAPANWHAARSPRPSSSRDSSSTSSPEASRRCATTGWPVPRAGGNSRAPERRSHPRHLRWHHHARPTIPRSPPMPSAWASPMPTAVRTVRSGACTSSRSCRDGDSHHESHRGTSSRSPRRALATRRPPSVFRRHGPRHPAAHASVHASDARLSDTRSTARLGAPTTPDTPPPPTGPRGTLRPPLKPQETHTGPPNFHSRIEFNQTLYRGSARQKVFTRWAALGCAHVHVQVH
jgi:hypothetical protein